MKKSALFTLLFSGLVSSAANAAIYGLVEVHHSLESLVVKNSQGDTVDVTLVNLSNEGDMEWISADPVITGFGTNISNTAAFDFRGPSSDSFDYSQTEFGNPIVQAHWSGFNGNSFLESFRNNELFTVEFI